MKEFLRQNRIFLLLYLTFLVFGGLITAMVDKGDDTLFFNALHTGFLNDAFKWITTLAEWPVLVFTILVTIRFGYFKGAMLGLNCLIVTAVTFAFKSFVFGGEARPASFFNNKVQLDFVQGVTIFHDQSFPSGHTSVAFALFFMLSILLENKNWSYLFFFLALLVGISRVYLLEHFFRDVYYGSIVGVSITLIVYVVFVHMLFRDGKEEVEENSASEI